MFDRLKEKGFEILALYHAEAILMHDMKDAVYELEETLLGLKIPVAELIRGGGGECGFTQWLRHTLSEKYGWEKHNFKIEKIVDGEVKESLSHEIDHVKKFETGTFALEIEWNNKDPFFDRDLENFKRLHADGIISIGCIITRGQTLQASLLDIVKEFAKKEKINNLEAIHKYYTPTPRQMRNINTKLKRGMAFEDAWAHVFVSDKFGMATTHWNKLLDRVNRGVGSPCPLLLIGIPENIVIL